VINVRFKLCYINFYSKITLYSDFSCNIEFFNVILHENHNIMSAMHIGNTIKTRRKELGITQPHLAELAHVSTNTLYKLERGQGNPTLSVLDKLAEVLGLELKLEVKKNNQ